MEPIRLGIIGCGIFARNRHLPVIKKLKDKFRIVAACNHTEKKAKEFCKLAGISDYVLDYHELLKRKDIEAVDIVLPIYMNYRVVLDSLKAGKHVIVEKPLAGNMSDAGKMLQFPKKYHSVMLLAENFRYHKKFLTVKKLLDEGRIGRTYAVIWNSIAYFDKNNKYVKTKWRAHNKHRGGFIADGGVHPVAGIRMLFGDIVSCAAFTDSINPDVGKIDTFSLQFKTEKGINGILNLFYSAIGSGNNTINIFADKGSIVIDDDRITIQKLGKKDVSMTIKNDGGYSGEFENFYDAIRKGKKVVSSFYEGYRDLEVINTALDSAQKERILKIK